MAAGGKAHDADAVRQHAVLGGFGAHGADGALRVAQFDGMMIARAEPVLEHKGRDADRVEPLRDLRAFIVQRQMRIPAAGADDDGGAGAAAFGHQAGRERGLIGVGGAERAGSAIRPEQLRLGRVARLREHGGRQQRDKQSANHGNTVPLGGASLATPACGRVFSWLLSERFPGNANLAVIKPGETYDRFS